jgi:hypothetical protein
VLTAPCITITSCVGDATGGAVSGVVGSIAGSAWEAVCKSFGDALVSLLAGFATAFTAFPSIDPTDPGIRSVYSISLGIAAVIAAILLLVQVTRTALTHDGTALAHAVTGLGKAVLAFLLTLTVAGAAITASNELTRFIVNRTFGSADGLKTRLGAVFVLDTFANGGSPSLLLFVAVIGILLVLVLWFELLLSNAAAAVMIGTSPIAAVGQTSSLTDGWWPKLVSATTQLIILKPVIALVFAVGFGLTGNATDLAGILSGMLVLLLAVLAWPAIARFFTFANIRIGGGSGLAALLGFAAGRVNGSSAGRGAPGVPEGLAGDDFAAASEQRAMATHAARTGGAGASGGAAGGGAAAGAAGGGAAAAGAAAGPLIVVAAALDAAQRAANALTGRMEQTAGFAGLDGANPHPYPAGYPRHAPVPFPRPTGDHHGGTQTPSGAGGPSPADPTWPGTAGRPDVDTDHVTAHAVEAPGTDPGAMAPLADHGVPDSTTESAPPAPTPGDGQAETPSVPGDGGSPGLTATTTATRMEATETTPAEPSAPEPSRPAGPSGADARVERRAVARPEPGVGPSPGTGSGPGSGSGGGTGPAAEGTSRRERNP